MIVCANAGDSRAILISEHMDIEQSQTKNISKFYCTQLSRDHKPDLPDEAERILKRNGRIEPSRTQNDGANTILGSPNQKQPKFYGPKRVWLKNK
jgi:serine/threonine protein phosphatase PrpC